MADKDKTDGKQVIDKMDKKIMVVRMSKLFGVKEENFFTGFRPANKFDYMPKILDNYQWKRRGDVEGDPSYKQPIAYTLIVNPKLGKVFVYQRETKDKKYIEGRLQGKISLGIGGHINEIDVVGSKNPIQASLEREMREEVKFQDGRVPGEKDIKTLGYLYDESDSVGTVHFGIISVAETDATIVLPKAPEIAGGGLKTIPELEGILQDPKCVVENWSKIAFGSLRQYLSN